MPDQNPDAQSTPGSFSPKLEALIAERSRQTDEMLEEALGYLAIPGLVDSLTDES